MSRLLHLSWTHSHLFALQGRCQSRTENTFFIRAGLSLPFSLYPIALSASRRSTSFFPFTIRLSVERKHTPTNNILSLSLVFVSFSDATSKAFDNNNNRESERALCESERTILRSISFSFSSILSLCRFAGGRSVCLCTLALSRGRLFWSNIESRGVCVEMWVEESTQPKTTTVKITTTTIKATTITTSRRRRRRSSLLCWTERVEEHKVKCKKIERKKEWIRWKKSAE